MFKHRFYMHKDCMDVFVEVLKSYKVDNSRYNIKVRWWNLGYDQNPYSIGIEERIDVKNPLDWVDITHTATNKRIKSGLPL